MPVPTPTSGAQLLDYIGTTLVDKLKDAKKSADSKLDEAKDKVKEWEEKKKPEMDANTKKIDELKKEEEVRLARPCSALLCVWGGGRQTSAAWSLQRGSC